MRDLPTAESCGTPEEVRWRAIEGYVDVHLRHRDTLTMLVRDMTLLVQAPIADRCRTAIARRMSLDGARALLEARGRGGGRLAILGDEQIAQVRALHAEGVAAEEIAARFGVSRATVYRCLENSKPRIKTTWFRY